MSWSNEVAARGETEPAVFLPRGAVVEDDQEQPEKRGQEQVEVEHRRSLHRVSLIKFDRLLDVMGCVFVTSTARIDCGDILKLGGVDMGDAETRSHGVSDCSPSRTGTFRGP